MLPKDALIAKEMTAFINFVNREPLDTGQRLNLWLRSRCGNLNSSKTLRCNMQRGHQEAHQHHTELFYPVAMWRLS